MSSSLLVRSGLFTPKIWQQTVRHRGKFNVRMPKPRHDIARYLEEITKPVIVKELSDPVEKCIETKKIITDRLKFGTENAIEFERFLAGYAANIFNESKAILICHKLDCDGEQFRRNKVDFKKNNTVLKNFNTVVMNLMIESNPKYKNLSPIVNNAIGRNLYLFSKEENVKKNLKLFKKMPHIVLLGGIINDTLMTRNGVLNYAKLDDIDTLRGQLVGMLNQQMNSLSTTLTSSQQRLSQALDQHASPETSE